MKQLIVILFICGVATANAQDTIKVYFEYGSAKVSEKDARMLRVLHSSYDMHDVEYAEFIGYADSIGDFDKNKELSEKRAKNVLKYCSNQFLSTADIRVLAKGEDLNLDQAENRRVEIILYYPTEIVISKAEVIEDVDPRCFYVDSDALKYCNVREIKKRGRRFMYIEALPVDLFKERKHYYLSSTNIGGKVSVNRVRWKMKTTGKLWWRKRRWVATIPRGSFLQYQFFTLEDAPCSGCTEEIFTEDTIIFTREEALPDYFLTQNMQAKIKIFKHQEVKIRVPREYIDLTKVYSMYTAVESKYRSSNRQQPIEWTTKKGLLGRKEHYYYTTVDIGDENLSHIFSTKMVTHCLNAPVWGEGGKASLYRLCGGVRNRIKGWNLGLYGVFEPGVFYHNDTLTGYAALGVAFHDRINLQLVAGINTHKGFYSSLNLRYPFASFRLRALSLENKWLGITELSPGGFRSPLVHMYAGLDSKTSYNRKYQSFLEGNLHLGLAIDQSIFGIFTEFYLQGGASYDFLQKVNSDIYPYGQFGIRFYTSSAV